MRPNKGRKQSAFTLVELSIVLVIIGLIIGGIVVGGELIKAAQIRKAISEIEEIKLMMTTFRLKYDGLPGDLRNASQAGVGTNGNGDGRIGQFPTTNTSEVWNFWRHLTAAGFLNYTFSGTAGPNGARHAVPGTNVLASEFRRGVGFTVVNWAGNTDPGFMFTPDVHSKIRDNVILFGVTGNTTSICCGFAEPTNRWETYALAFTPAEAFAIDTKIDDGKPASGNAIDVFPVYFPGCTTNTNSTTAEYNITNNAVSCSFLIKTGTY